MIDFYLEKFARHLRILRGLSSKTITSYDRKIREFYTLRGPQAPDARDLIFTRSDVEAFLEGCFYRGNTNSTRLTKLIALRRWSHFLVYEGILPQDLTVEIPRPRTVRRLVQILTRAEILKILSVINPSTDKGLRDLVIFILAAFMGLRIGEIVNLNVSDIVEMDDTAPGGLHLQIINSKHGGSRVVTLWKRPSAFVRGLLTVRAGQRAKAQDPLIVSYTKGGRLTGNRISRDTLIYMLKAYAKQAGIKRSTHWHMFRASHATTLRSIASYDLPAIAARLGHRNIATTAQNYLADWGRVRKTYPSLAAYWTEFNDSLWTHEDKPRSSEV